MQPVETLLVVDAMTGQEAVGVAQAFAGGGARHRARSSRRSMATRAAAPRSRSRPSRGIGVKFLGTGEKTDALEVFHPDRLAGRILGMGDVLTLVERAQEHVDASQAARLEEKLRKAEFTLEDFLDQLQQVQKMGPIGQLMSMLPGMGDIAKDAQAAVDRGDLSRTEAIIRSMTTPRAARPGRSSPAPGGAGSPPGSGTSLTDVNRLVKQFTEMQRVMKQLAGGRGRGMLGGLPIGRR